jgi:hypothetical protein
VGVIGCHFDEHSEEKSRFCAKSMQEKAVARMQCNGIRDNLGAALYPRITLWLHPGYLFCEKICR